MPQTPLGPPDLLAVFRGPISEGRKGGKGEGRKEWREGRKGANRDDGPQTKILNMSLVGPAAV